MAISSDFHLHSEFSGDCKAPMEDMIKKGIQIGLERMCFTEHMDWDFPPMPYTVDFTLDTVSYRETFLNLKEKYKNKIQLLWGVELGLQTQIAEWNDTYANSYPFDFIIGSSHLCEKMDPYLPVFFEGRSPKEAYISYFESIYENLKVFHNFDVYGHLDYVVRYGPKKGKDYDPKEYMDLFDLILKDIIDHGKGIELNTAGLNKGLEFMNPADDILLRYRELGGEVITIGSDAHHPDNLGQYFREAHTKLIDLGFRYYTIFESRKPKMLPLN